jgi:hypothetical protein
MKSTLPSAFSRKLRFEPVAAWCCLVAGLAALGCGKRDSTDSVARMVSKDPLRSGKVLSALPANANPIERILYDKSPVCHACAIHGCADQLARSANIEQVATDGPAQGKTKAALAQTALQCALRKGCVRKGASVACYCGTATGPDCISAAANGPCKSELEASLETTDPKRIAMEFTHDDTGGGAAMNLVLCLTKRECSSTCF